MYYLYSLKQNNMVTPIKETKLLKKGKEINGWFKLKNGTKTKFSISNDGSWEQWGNTRDNLCLTVPYVERLMMDLLYRE